MKKPTQFLRGKFISLEIAITNKQKKALLVTLILLILVFILIDEINWALIEGYRMG